MHVPNRKSEIDFRLIAIMNASIDWPHLASDEDMHSCGSQSRPYFPSIIVDRSTETSIRQMTTTTLLLTSTATGPKSAASERGRRDGGSLPTAAGAEW